MAGIEGEGVLEKHERLLTETAGKTSEKLFQEIMVNASRSAIQIVAEKHPTGGKTNILLSQGLFMLPEELEKLKKQNEEKGYPSF